MLARRTVVIGAGFGGLAAALRARALGDRTVLLDRRPGPGGRARTLQTGAYRLDAGPTVITAPFLFEELFALFGERLADHVTLMPVDPFYRICFADGSAFDYGGDPERMEAEVVRTSPDDLDGYRRLMRDAARLYRTGYETYGSVPFHRVRTMLGAFPAILAAGGHRSVHALAAQKLRSEKLRRVFTLQPLLVGGHPYRTSGIYGLIPHLERTHGVWYAKGGTAALVEALSGLAARHGVELRWNSDVAAIRTGPDGRRATGVELADGSFVAADAIVSNVDPTTLYREMVGPARACAGLGSIVARANLARMTYSMGLYVMCFVTSRRYPDIAHHTIVLGKRWKALLDEIFGARAALPSDPSLYLHRPTATDPQAAPPGTDFFYVLAPVPNLRAPIDWNRAAPIIRDRVIELLEARLMPGLRAAIIAHSEMTPEDFRADYRSTHGAGFSIAPTLLQSAWFRFHNRSSVLDNLVLVGAGTHPGAGLPGVLTSARIAGRLLEQMQARDERTSRSRIGGRLEVETASP